MNYLKLASGVVAASVIAIGAQAQTIGIGSTKGGATAQVTAAISKVVTTGTDLKMRPQPMGGTQQYIPVVNAGEMDFGVSNLPQYWMAITGTGLSKRKHENLRLAATMMVFRPGVIVTGESGIKTIQDLKGKRIPHGFKAAPLFQFLMTAAMATGGVGWDDVEKVPAIALRQHWNMFKQGKIDAVIGAAGTAVIKDLNATMPGGVQYIPLPDTPEAVAAMQKYYPKSYMKVIQPAKPLVGIVKPTNTIHFDYTLWTHKGQKDEVVYKVVKAMYENEKALHETSPLWRSHKSKNMAKDQGAPHHPGAVKFYKEVGLLK